MISSQRNTGWATVSTVNQLIQKNQKQNPIEKRATQPFARSSWRQHVDSLPVRITLLFSALFVCIALYIIDSIFGLWIYEVPVDSQTKGLLRELFLDIYIQRISTGMLLALSMVITCGVYLRHFTRRNMQPLLKFAHQIATRQTGDSKKQAVLEGPLSGEFREIGGAMQAMNNQLATYEDQRIALLKRITHDVRTPLTVIQTLASMQQPKQQQDQPNALATETDWELVDACAVQLGRLLDDLGYLVGNNAGSTYEPSPNSTMDLLPAIDQLVSYHEARLSQRGIGFTVLLTNANGQLREPTAKQCVYQVAMDFTRFSQLLGNLIDNAIEHGKATQIELKVRPVSPNMIRLRVCDNGQGMSDTVRERVFEDGFTLSNDGHAHQGLGLAIVSDIVNAHGGSISVINNPHSGTIFDILLPLKKE